MLIACLVPLLLAATPDAAAPLPLPWTRLQAVTTVLPGEEPAPTELVARHVRVLTRETRSYPVGTRGSDVRTMLAAVRANTRAQLAVPAAFGDLTVDVETLWVGDVDWDGDGADEHTMLRVVTVPGLTESEPIVTVTWLVAIRGDAEGAVGPDEEKEGIVLAAAHAVGTTSPITGVALDPKGRSATYALAAPGGKTATLRHVRLGDEASRPEVGLAFDEALAESARLVYDRMVLAPETAYVKAFIRKEFQAEVDRVEPVRGLAIPEVVRPLYRGLRGIVLHIDGADSATTLEQKNPLAADVARVLVRECDLALSLSAAESRERVEALQKLSKEWRALEEKLSFAGRAMRRQDFEERLTTTADANERLALARAYEAAFAPLYAEGGGYARLIARLNEMARARGFRTYVDMRVREVFGVDGDTFRAWMAEAFTETEAPARAFVRKLAEEKGEGPIGYWELRYLAKDWLKRRLLLAALPKIDESAARRILTRYLGDLGFDLGRAPYDRITMDWYDDPLKQSASGVAATATPRDAYFTSNLKPGKPIAIDEFETIVHESLHTLHYQTSGEASGGSSAYQNLMYSYVAEGVTMAGQDLPWATPALMRRYFGDLPGFEGDLFEIYPEAQRQAVAWDLRRLLVMALMEINLFEDRRPDGSPRPWAERLGAWRELLAERLWVVPDGIELGEILCRMHPTADQHQLMYASYPLGRILVGRIRDRIVKKGTPGELARYGEILRTLMRRGALADMAFVKGL